MTTQKKRGITRPRPDGGVKKKTGITSPRPDGGVTSYRYPMDPIFIQNTTKLHTSMKSIRNAAKQLYTVVRIRRPLLAKAVICVDLERKKKQEKISCVEC